MRSFIFRIRMLLVFAAAGLGCIAVHETGHVVAGLATGGRVTKIAILSLDPHVTIRGKTTSVRTALRAVAGSSLLLLGWSLYLLLAPRAALAGPVFAVWTCFAGAELLGWSLAACLYPNGPRATDAWKFLELSGLGAAVVVSVCLLIGLAGALLHRHRTRRTGLQPQRIAVRPAPTCNDARVSA